MVYVHSAAGTAGGLTYLISGSHACYGEGCATYILQGVQGAHWYANEAATFQCSDLRMDHHNQIYLD